MTDNQKQILADAVKVLGDLGISIASGGTASAALLADVPVAKDALERILLELPPIDAADLDPKDRADADASAQAAADAKFGPKE